MGARVHRGDGNRNAHAAAANQRGHHGAWRRSIWPCARLDERSAPDAGHIVVQDGQLGAQTSLFIRGGDSDDNKILVDGVDAGDLGRQFDFGPLSTTAVESAEVYRGPDSNLYGAGAETGVVSLTTPHGTTSFPSLLFQGDAGNFYTSREQLRGGRRSQ